MKMKRERNFLLNFSTEATAGELVEIIDASDNEWILVRRYFSFDLSRSFKLFFLVGNCVNDLSE